MDIAPERGATLGGQCVKAFPPGRVLQSNLARALTDQAFSLNVNCYTKKRPRSQFFRLPPWSPRPPSKYPLLLKPTGNLFFNCSHARSAGPGASKRVTPRRSTARLLHSPPPVELHPDHCNQIHGGGLQIRPVARYQLPTVGDE